MCALSSTPGFPPWFPPENLHFRHQIELIVRNGAIGSHTWICFYSFGEDRVKGSLMSSENVQMPPRNSGMSVAVMVLGIVGLVLLCGYGIGLVPSIVALAMAPAAKREIAAAGGQLGGTGFIKAGVICAWVAVGIAATAIVAGVIAIIIAAATS